MRVHAPLEVIGAILLVWLAAALPVFAGQWIHIEPTSSGNPCAARLAGGEVDVTLTLNRNDELIVVAGRADWRASGSQSIALGIDDFKTTQLQATAFNNLVIVLINDQSIVNRLSIAKDVRWYLPSGTYHAAIIGLGDALSWVRTCEAAKRSGLPQGG